MSYQQNETWTINDGNTSYFGKIDVSNVSMINQNGAYYDIFGQNISVVFGLDGKTYDSTMNNIHFGTPAYYTLNAGGLVNLRLGMVGQTTYYVINIKNQSQTTVNLYNSSNIGLNISTIPVNQEVWIYGTYNGSSLTSDPVVTMSDPSCLHGQTLVQTFDGYKPIHKICSGDMVIGQNGELIEVLYNIKFTIPTNRFIKISKDALGYGRPINDMLITHGHPLILNNVEISCEKLLNNKTITEIELDEKQIVYAICTKDRNGIITEGLPVLTWSQADWELIYKKNKILWTRNDSTNLELFD
jgi:hypothetical protein